MINKNMENRVLGPDNIFLQVNYECYLKCVMCDRHTWIKNKANIDNVLTNVELTDLFVQLAKLGTKKITLVGTDPVIRPDIKDILSKIKSLGMKPELYTAGIVLKDDLINSILKNYVDISFSIDGFKRDSHNRIRYPDGKFDAFGKTISSIKRLSNARNLTRLTKNDVRILANFTLQSENINDLNTVTADQIDYFGVDTLRISIAHGNGSYKLDRKAIPTIKKFIVDINNLNTKTEIIFSTTINNMGLGLIEPDDFDQDILIPSSLFKENKLATCPISKISAMIDPQGNVYPCLYLYNDNGSYQDKSRQKFIMGTIKSQLFGDIWNGKKYNNFRKGKYPDLSTGSKCLTCEYI